MQKIVFLLCEGPHDTAFIYRILKTIGLKNYSVKIKEFPKPIDAFISKFVKDSAIDEMKLEEIRTRPIPSESLTYQNKTLVLLYSVHGDSKKSIRKDIIRSIRSFVPEDLDGLNPLGNTTLSVLYFFDSDDKGVDRRLAEVKKELNEFLEDSIPEDCFRQNGSLHDINNIVYGVYIFAASNDKGKLEDILLPLMKRDNERIFDEAKKYLQLKDDTRLKKLEIKEENGVITEQRSGKTMTFDSAKSEICIAGQLQNSGKSNVVIIKDCDYITLSKIETFPKCREISEFLKKVL